jgi:signal transduction histidine kinase/DNA-binding NarL/FixJ family response regulator
MPENDTDRVSRRRYVREQQARNEAESLLERKSRELFQANTELSKHSEKLEKAVFERTRALSIALDQAEAASAARSRFIATMSHEIRTPLAGLLGMIDLLSLDETDEEKRELLRNAQVSGLGLNRIVNDVLDFSKMEAGLFAFENESVDIRALTKSVLVLAQTNLTGEGRVIEALIDQDVPQLFLGDATRIRQVISNLVSNAVRYSKRGPITINVSSMPDIKGALLRMEVQDHGVGVAENQIENLFKDFSQISNPLTAAAQGTGLGLAISKRIIEGCDGTIGVNSVADKGSTFWIELPVKVLTAPEREPEAELKSDPADIGASLSGRRILLAEDNPINQKLLLTYLKRMDIEAELAENGRIALDKFGPGKFDLILMDVAMPEMDGLSAIRHIRARWDPFEVPPIIVLTAHVMDAIEDDAALVGVDTLLSKPIPFDELKRALANALQDKKPVEEKIIIDLLAKLGPGVPAVASLMSPNVVEDLLDSFSNDEFTDLVESYAAQVEDLVTKITDNYTTSRFDLVIESAHSLKGSSLLLGFNDIAKVASEIEKQAQTLGQEQLLLKTSEIRKQLRVIEGRL